MPPKRKKADADIIAELLSEEPTLLDRQIQVLQEDLTAERDARREDRFFFIGVLVLLLDVVIFSVMPNFGGPLALLVLVSIQERRVE